jgi:hypothetical protein
MIVTAERVGTSEKKAMDFRDSVKFLDVLRIGEGVLWENYENPFLKKFLVYFDKKTEIKILFFHF